MGGSTGVPFRDVFVDVFDEAGRVAFADALCVVFAVTLPDGSVGVRFCVAPAVAFFDALLVTFNDGDVGKFGGKPPGFIKS